MKTYYYLYQITNLVNAKIYVGVHKTKSLDDGYMGSGKIIRSAIEKHGISNFSKVILEFFDTSEAMYAREKEVVTNEFLLREDTYNLRRGGTGGFDYINRNQLNAKGHSQTRSNRIKVLQESSSKGGKSRFIKHGVHENFKQAGRTSFLRKHHSAETKQKMSLTKKGTGLQDNNSQFGTMWITDGTNNKKIKKGLVIPEGWNKGRK